MTHTPVFLCNVFNVKASGRDSALCVLPSLSQTTATTPQLTICSPLTPQNIRLTAKHRLKQTPCKDKKQRLVLCAEACEAKRESD